MLRAPQYHDRRRRPTTFLSSPDDNSHSVVWATSPAAAEASGNGKEHRTTTTTTTATTERPREQTPAQWAVTFGGMMVPFVGFLHAHQKGYFVAAVERIAKSRFGVHGLLLMPFFTLSAEKCIYDTIQCLQGINPQVIPEGRGGFPSGGANLPSFSLVSVQNW